MGEELKCYILRWRWCSRHYSEFILFITCQLRVTPKTSFSHDYMTPRQNKIIDTFTITLVCKKLDSAPKYHIHEPTWLPPQLAEHWVRIRKVVGSILNVARHSSWLASRCAWMKNSGKKQPLQKQYESNWTGVHGILTWKICVQHDFTSFFSRSFVNYFNSESEHRVQFSSERRSRS